MQVLHVLLTIIWGYLYNLPLLIRIIVIMLAAGIIFKLVILRVLPFILSLLVTITGKLISFIFILLLFPGWVYNLFMRRSGHEPGALLSIIEDLISLIISFFDQTANKIKKFKPETVEFSKVKKAYNAIWIIGTILIICLVVNNSEYTQKWYALEQILGKDDSVNVAQISPQYLVAKTDLNLRSGPGKQNRIVGGAKKGETLRYSNISQNDANNLIWYKVVAQTGTEGWVSSQLVEFAIQSAPQK